MEFNLPAINFSAIGRAASRLYSEEMRRVRAFNPAEMAGYQRRPSAAVRVASVVGILAAGALVGVGAVLLVAPGARDARKAIGRGIARFLRIPEHVDRAAAQWPTEVQGTVATPAASEAPAIKSDVPVRATATNHVAPEAPTVKLDAPIRATEPTPSAAPAKSAPQTTPRWPNNGAHATIVESTAERAKLL